MAGQTCRWRHDVLKPVYGIDSYSLRFGLFVVVYELAVHRRREFTVER